MSADLQDFNIKHSTIEHVTISYSVFHTAMPKQRLNRADVEAKRE
jgi:hypothetical protein